MTGAYGNIANAQDSGMRPTSVYARSPYSMLVLRQIHKHKFYPAKAKKAEQTGAVRFSFTIGPNGRVVEHRILQSSGHPALDATVSRVLQKVRVGPPPMGHSRFATSLVFRLSDDAPDE